MRRRGGINVFSTIIALLIVDWISRPHTRKEEYRQQRLSGEPPEGDPMQHPGHLRAQTGGGGAATADRGTAGAQRGVNALQSRGRGPRAADGGTETTDQ